MANPNDNTIILASSAVVGTTETGAARPCLIQVVGPQTGRTIVLRRRQVLLGRSADCDIVLYDSGASRLHARITETDEGLVLSDLGSTNGTFVNGQPVVTHLLKEGDRVQVGSATLFRFSYQDSIDEQFQRNLYASATQDALTGLYNRKYFLDRLGADFNHAHRHGRPISLAMLDIDYFKKINDTHGHLAGDAVLGQLATVLSGASRSEDLVARWGGEEFALIYRDADAPRATISGERLRRLVEKTPFRYDGRILPVSISIGIATLEGGNFVDEENLVRDADTFLYLAKRKGRNRVESILTGGDPACVARELSRLAESACGG